MRETDRLDRQFDVTVFRGAEEELAAVNVTASGKPDCPGTRNGALGRVSSFGRKRAWVIGIASSVERKKVKS